MIQKAKSIFSRWNNITILQIIFFFSSLYFYTPVLTLYFQKLGLTLWQITSLESLLLAGIILFQIPSGIFADKYGRKKAIIFAFFLIFLAELLFFFARDFWIFVVISFISGAGIAFYSGAVEALIYDSLKLIRQEKQMKKASGRVFSMYALAAVVAAPIGGYLAKDLSIEQVSILIILTASTSAIAFALTFFIQEPLHSRRFEDITKLDPNTLQGAFNILKNNPSLRRIIALQTLSVPFVFYLLILYPPYATKLGVRPVYLGIILALASSADFICSRYAYKLEGLLGVSRSTILITILPAICYFLFATLSNPLIASLLFITIYAVHGSRDPIFIDYLNLHIGSEQRATVLSVIGVMSTIYLALMGSFIGLLAEYSISYAFIFMGGIILISSVFFRINKKHISV